jgi:hypothetical protein
MLKKANLLIKVGLAAVVDRYDPPIGVFSGRQDQSHRFA